MCFSCPVEQKHPPQPGHPRGTGSNLRAPRPASPPAEPQTAAGNDRPAAGRAGSAHTAEPGAPQRGANQTLCCHSGHRSRCCHLGQRQGSQGSLEALTEQRQTRHQHVRCLLSDASGGSALLYVSTAGQLSCSVSCHPLEISLCWIHEFISKCVKVAAMEKKRICYTVFGFLTLVNTNRVARFTFSHAKHTKRSTVAAVGDNWLLLRETRWTILLNSQCQACMKEEGGRRRNEGIHKTRKRMKERGRDRPLGLVCEEKFIFYREPTGYKFNPCI